MNACSDAHTRASRVRPLTGCLLLAIAGGAMFAPVEARPAAERVTSVTNCDDAGPGSLREAMQNAAAGDTIDLSALDCSVISLTTGALSIDVNNVTLEGPGAAALTIEGGYSAGRVNRVISHHGTGLLSITNLTVTDARYVQDTASSANGGCIYSSGNLYLGHAVVTGCTAIGTSGAARGGGVYAYGTLKVKYSTISDNLASSGARSSIGGGTFSRGLTTVQSTFDNNRALATPPNLGAGGGMFTIAGTVSIAATTISNNLASREAGLGAHNIVTMSIASSTVSGNQAIYGTGGVYASIGEVSIANSTIAFNTARYNGGVELQYAHANFQSSIIAENYADGQRSDIEAYHASTASDGANNIIRASHTTLPADTITSDPMLHALTDNGGPTRTHAPKAGSPAIDAGNNAGNVATDQRGTPYARSVGAGPDIGAFERQSEIDGDIIFADDFEA